MVSPLLMAASGGHHEVVKLLIQNGAEVNHKDIVSSFFSKLSIKKKFQISIRLEIRR